MEAKAVNVSSTDFQSVKVAFEALEAAQKTGDKTKQYVAARALQRSLATYASLVFQHY